MAEPMRVRAQLDLRLQDPAALEEIELYSELIILAGASDEPLSRDAIDRALGVRPARSGGRLSRGGTARRCPSG